MKAARAPKVTWAKCWLLQAEKSVTFCSVNTSYLLHHPSMGWDWGNFGRKQVQFDDRQQKGSLKCLAFFVNKSEDKGADLHPFLVISVG